MTMETNEPIWVMPTFGRRPGPTVSTRCDGRNAWFGVQALRLKVYVRDLHDLSLEEPYVAFVPYFQTVKTDLELKVIPKNNPAWGEPTRDFDQTVGMFTRILGSPKLLIGYKVPAEVTNLDIVVDPDKCVPRAMQGLFSGGASPVSWFFTVDERRALWRNLQEAMLYLDQYVEVSYPSMTVHPFVDAPKDN